MKKLLLLTGLFIGFFATAQNAADPAILFKTYPNFSTGNILNPNFSNPGQISVPSGAVEQTDGKILSFGFFTNFKEASQKRLIRLNADGTKDNSFDVGSGFEHIPNVQGQVDCFLKTVVQQTDGKILVGGYFNRFNGAVQNGLVRLNADGTIDTGFNSGTGFIQGSFPGVIEKIIVLSDNKILVSGSYLQYNGTTANGLIRLNPDGTRDTSFVVVPNLYGSASDMVIQTDGKIVVGLYGINSLTPKMYRINTNGTLDTTFNIGVGFDNSVNQIVLQPDGKFLVAGFFTTYKGSAVNKFVRLNPDASLDTTFNMGTLSTTQLIGVAKMAITAANKIIICGNFTTYSGVSVSNMLRLNTDGTLDYQYSIPNAGLVSSFSFLQSGQLLIFSNYLYKINAKSSLVDTFDIAEGFDGGVSNIEITTDNKLFVSGGFDIFKGYSHKGLVKLDSNGKRDFSFARNNFSGGTINVTKTMPDEKLLVGGSFTTFNGSAVKKIILLNSDGTLDTTFNAGGPNLVNISGGIFSISIQNDGKIVISGDFTFVFSSGPALGRLIRLNADGTIDTTFNNGTNTGITDGVITTLQPDGKIIATGNFQYIGFGNYNRIARFNTNGTLDTTFISGTGFDSNTNRCVVQPDGKIIVVGNFTNYNGTTANRIIRLNPNGSYDSTFTIGTGFNSSASSLAQQNDGKIVVVGNFTTYNNSTQNRIVVLNTNGTLDTTFNSGDGFFQVASIVKIDNTGSIWTGGGLFTYNNAVNNYLVKLNGTPVTLGADNFTNFNHFNNLKIYPNPTTGNFNIAVEEKLVGSNVSVYNILGQKVKEFQLDGLNTNQNLDKGIYILEIEKEGNRTTRKLIVN